MPFVLDASVAVAWHFEDETTEFTERMLERLEQDDAVVPPIWAMEVANALLSAERRGRLSQAGATRAASQMLELPISVVPMRSELPLNEGLDLARAQGVSVYDAMYLQLAISEQLPLATLDQALADAAIRRGVALVE